MDVGFNKAVVVVGAVVGDAGLEGIELRGESCALEVVETCDIAFAVDIDDDKATGEFVETTADVEGDGWLDAVEIELMSDGIDVVLLLRV